MGFSKAAFIFRISVILSAVIISTTNAAPTEDSPGFGPGNQKWGFVDVREGAHMFWWLYYTTSPNVSSPVERPLAIWLQGGPGASSTGYGNFAELGPLDFELNPRNFTWVKDMNVLFFDSPVGTGFSYVDDSRFLARDNLQVGKDLVELLRGFYKELPEFKSVPLHIFSESYGGKTAVEFAYLLNQEIEERRIDCNFKSVSSIDGFISPADTTLSWAPFLYEMGFVDDIGRDAIAKQTKITLDALDNDRFTDSTNLWFRTELTILEQTHGIDFYNVLTPQTTANFNSRISLLKTNLESALYRTLVKHDARDLTDDIIEELMLGPVSAALDIPKHVKWGSQSRQVFNRLAGDFMKPVIHIVEKLLNETSIEVNIITGQLDLIVATPGTVAWVNKVNWPGKAGYVSSKREYIGVNNVIEGYYKRFNKFALYWANRAGHMVPFDNPAAMDYILRTVTKYNQ